MASSIANNYLVQATGKLLTVLLGLFAVAVLTRHLGKEGFGSYTTAMTYLTIFGTIVEFGMTLTLIQMISVEKEQEQKIINGVLGLRLASGILFYSLAPLLVQLFSYSELTKMAVLVGTLGYFFMTSAGILIGFFQKHLIIWRFAFSEILNRGTFLFFVLLFSFWNLGTLWMVAGFVFANIIWFFSVATLAKPYIKIRPSFEKTIWKQALQRSWPIGVSTICNLVYLRGDILFLAAFRGEAVVAIYGVAYKILDVVTMVPVMLMGLLIPPLAEAWKEKNITRFAHLTQNAFDFFIIISIPVLIGTQVVAEPLSVLIGGSDYKASGPILQWLIFVVIGLFLSSLYGHAIVALEKQRPMAWGYGLTALLTVLGYFLLIPPFGVWGAVAMTLFSEFLMTTLTFAVVYKTTKLLPKLHIVLKAVVASVLMYLVLITLPALPVLLTIVIGGLVYAAGLFVLGGIKTATLKQLFLKT